MIVEIALYGLAAIGLLVVVLAVIVMVGALTEPKSYYNCCTGDCNQGRDCPARLYGKGTKQ